MPRTTGAPLLRRGSARREPRRVRELWLWRESALIGCPTNPRRSSSTATAHSEPDTRPTSDEAFHRTDRRDTAIPCLLPSTEKNRTESPTDIGSIWKTVLETAWSVAPRWMERALPRYIPIVSTPSGRPCSHRRSSHPRHRGTPPGRIPNSLPYAV